MNTGRRRGRPMNIVWRHSLEELQARFDAESDVQLRLRLHALMDLQRGESIRQVAAKLGVGYRTLQGWVHWYRRDGLEALLERTPGQNAVGRPSRLNPQQIEALRRRAAEAPFATMQDVVDWVYVQWGVTYTLKGMYALCERRSIACTLGQNRRL